jgi:hypothetical protein
MGFQPGQCVSADLSDKIYYANNQWVTQFTIIRPTTIVKSGRNALGRAGRYGLSSLSNIDASRARLQSTPRPKVSARPATGRADMRGLGTACAAQRHREDGTGSGRACCRQPVGTRRLYPIPTKGPDR